MVDARDVIGRLLRVVRTPEALLAELADVSRQLNELGDNAIGALDEALRSKSRIARTIAAGLSLALYRGAASEDDASETAHAVAVISESLMLGKGLEQRVACALMSLGRVPPGALPGLLHTMSARDARLRVLAAAGVSKCPAASTQDAQRARSILEGGLRLKDEATAVISAVALILAGTCENAAMQVIVRSLSEPVGPFQYSLLSIIAELGHRAGGALNVVAKLLTGTNVDPRIRAVAAKAVGAISANRRKALALLAAALRCTEWEVVEGAIDGLMRCGGIPNEEIGVLIKHVAEGNEDMCRTAARGLRLLGSTAAEALPALFERMGRSAREDVFESISGAIAAMGLRALPDLIRLIRQRDQTKLPSVMQALGILAESAPADVLPVLIRENDAATRRTAVAIATELGARAAPAVPALGKMLRHADNDDEIQHVLMALFCVGEAAKEALPDLLHCLVEGSEVAAWGAMRMMWHLRPEASATLTAALKTATGRARDRITRALQGAQGVDERLRRFREFNNDKALRTYLSVARIMAACKRAMSWDEVVQQLEQQDIAGQLLHKQSLSLRAIADAVKRVEELLEYRLTTRKMGKKGMILTQALDELPLIEEYLESA